MPANEKRMQVVKKIHDAFQLGITEYRETLQDGVLPEFLKGVNRTQGLSANLENCIFEKFDKDLNKEYKNYVRMLCGNLLDQKNQLLRRLLVQGKVSTQQLLAVHGEDVSMISRAISDEEPSQSNKKRKLSRECIENSVDKGSGILSDDKKQAVQATSQWLLNELSLSNVSDEIKASISQEIYDRTNKIIIGSLK
jgi:Transcription factor S-II (TFIIS), central domain